MNQNKKIRVLRIIFTIVIVSFIWIGFSLDQYFNSEITETIAFVFSYILIAMLLENFTNFFNKKLK